LFIYLRLFLNGNAVTVRKGDLEEKRSRQKIALCFFINQECSWLVSASCSIKQTPVTQVLKEQLRGLLYLKEQCRGFIQKKT
jgi:hypothetical protein